MQLRHRGGNNSNQRGNNDDNNQDINMNHHGVHDIINSLQPINTNNYPPPSRMHHFPNSLGHMNPNDMQRANGWPPQHHHHDAHMWSSDMLSVNTPTNYDELFNQLSAPTPMISSQIHRGNSHDVTLPPSNSTIGRGIPTTIYVNQLTAASNDSDDLLTYPSFPDTGKTSKTNTTTANNNNQMMGMNSEKKKVSDAITYGPRFCEIFYRYCEDMKQTIDTKRHLMSLCIDNLIPFICWARDTEDRVRWMSSLLFENDYLRPEVRNGIVIVLIYTFASIKASHAGVGDMFTVLQDNDDGLGIANRFSLKIYNDPFGYLSCLKFSISSLIDAGAIPENERLNKPFKKGTSKPLPVNQEEIQAFQKVKNRIAGLLDQQQVSEAKALVQVITTHWQFRGNALRTKRFMSALDIMNQPTNVDIANTVYQEKMQLAREGKLVEEPVTTLADIKNMGSNKNKANPRKHGLNSDEGGSRGGGGGSINEPNKRVKYDEDQSNQPYGNPSSSAPTSEKKDNNAAFPNSLERISNASEKPSNSDLYSSGSEGSVNDTPQQTQLLPKILTNPTPLNNTFIRPFSFKAIRFERIGINEWKMKETIIFDIQQFIESLINMQLSSSTSSSSINSTGPATGTDFNIYLLNEKPLSPSLQEGYLRINHAISTPRILHPNASSGGTMNSIISGIVSLEQELKKLSSITTSWHVHELPQFQQFLLAYYQQYVLTAAANASSTPANTTMSNATSPSAVSITRGKSASGISLHQFWNQFDHHSPSNHGPSSQAPTPLSINTSSNPLMSALVLGCIGYEVSSSMMLIIRENKFLGIHSDIWCKLYPNDFTHAMEELLYPLQQQQMKQQQKEGNNNDYHNRSSIDSNTAKITFGDILMYFFPQLSILERKLTISSQQLSQKKGITVQFTLDDIFVKYAPITPSPQQPSSNIADDCSIRSETDLSRSAMSILPPQGNTSAYQTIGVFTTPAKKILARLQSQAKIHDFILEIDTEF